MPQRERLAAAPLVCGDWEAAAVAASTQVGAYFTCGKGAEQREAKQRSLALWLETHGMLVQQLRVVNSAGLTLPFENLQQLRACTLISCSLPQPQGLAGSSSSTLCDLISLTSLRLSKVKLFDSGLQALSVLTGLRRLHLAEVAAIGANPHRQLGSLCLKQLAQLTQLYVEMGMFPKGARAVFSSLQRLQQLEVNTFGWGPRVWRSRMAVFERLPPSLVVLQLPVHLTTAAQVPVVSSSSLPALKALTRLQQLDLPCPMSMVQGRLVYCSVLTDFLSSMPQLRQLHLGRLSSDALPALLAAMPGLTCLESVRLSGNMLTPLPPEQYSSTAHCCRPAHS
jgi:hypothetical protein